MISHISQLQAGFGSEKEIDDRRLIAGHSWWVVVLLMGWWPYQRTSFINLVIFRILNQDYALSSPTWPTFSIAPRKGNLSLQLAHTYSLQTNSSEFHELDTSRPIR